MEVLMESLSKEFEVRLATLEEVCIILREPRLLSAVNLTSASDIPEYFHSLKYSLYLAKHKEDSLLFMFKEICLGVFEVHIACPERSKLKSRLLAYVALKWIYLRDGHYVKYFYTSCPEGKIANFIRKFGATQIKRTGDTVHFMATPETFQLTK